AQGASEIEIRADLVVGCDGRHSTIRTRAGLPGRDLGAPMDVLWFRIEKKSEDPADTMGRFAPGAIVVLLNRGDYWLRVCHCQGLARRASARRARCLQGEPHAAGAAICRTARCAQELGRYQAPDCRGR